MAWLPLEQRRRDAVFSCLGCTRGLCAEARACVLQTLCSPWTGAWAVRGTATLVARVTGRGEAGRMTRCVNGTSELWGRVFKGPSGCVQSPSCAVCGAVTGRWCPAAWPLAAFPGRGHPPSELSAQRLGLAVRSRCEWFAPAGILTTTLRWKLLDL